MSKVPGNPNEVIERLLADTHRRLEALERKDKWHVVGAAGEPAFENSWATYAGYGDEVAFRREGTRVWFRGLASRTGATNLAIFTLPAGYRPSVTKWISVSVYNGAYIAGRLGVNTSGTVWPEGVAAEWMPFGGISFDLGDLA